jgi:hypothetical protein
MTAANHPRPDLAQIQRWMQAAIMHPDGVVEGINAPETRAHIDVGAEEADTVLTRSRALTAVERLGIYSSAYYARLLEVLREEFPILTHAFGADVFDSFAVGYLQQYPSRSYTLAELGRAFSRYLEETRPEREAGDEAPDWADLLIDLALLERTFSEVFDGPGVEGQPLLSAEELATLPAERWLEARLVPVPCLRLLRLRYPVADYYVAVRTTGDADLPGPAETFLAVTRRRYVVRHYPLARTEYAILNALVGGQTVGEAIEVGVQEAGPDLEALAGQLQGWFQYWAANGFFAGVEYTSQPG